MYLSLTEKEFGHFNDSMKSRPPYWINFLGNCEGAWSPIFDF